MRQPWDFIWDKLGFHMSPIPLPSLLPSPLSPLKTLLRRIRLPIIDHEIPACRPYCVSCLSLRIHHRAYRIHCDVLYACVPSSIPLFTLHWLLPTWWNRLFRAFSTRICFLKKNQNTIIPNHNRSQHWYIRERKLNMGELSHVTSVTNFIELDLNQSNLDICPVQHVYVAHFWTSERTNLKNCETARWHEGVRDGIDIRQDDRYE